MQRLSRALLTLLLGLTLWPASLRAQEVDEPAGRGEAASEEEEALEAEPGSEAIAPPSGVEVIRIKGRAVTAIETDVPASVTQFDASELEALGAQSVADLAKVTPNLEIKVAGATAPTFFIRGVGLSDFNANSAGAIAVYQDDVAINAPAIQLGLLYDLENIEVLKGPQGAGSGRNASGGAIKIRSRKPTGELAADLRSSLGRFDSRDFEGAIEVPIVEEMIAARFAFRLFERDPYAKNGCADGPSLEEKGIGQVPGRIEGNMVPGIVDVEKAEEWEGFTLCNEQLVRLINPDWFPGSGLDQTIPLSLVPGGLPSDVNDAGVWAARGQIRFQPPGTDMDWLLNAHGSRLDQQSTLGQAMGTAEGQSPTGGFSTGGLGGFTEGQYREPDQVEMALELSEVELAEELARNLDIRPFRGDYNGVGQTKLDTWGTFLRGDWSIGAVEFTSISAYDTYERFREQDQDFTPNVLFEAVSTDAAWQFTQELKAGGELRDTPFRWEVGGYYLMEELEARVESTLYIPLLDSVREYTQDTWSFAFFGDFSWDFLDDFTLEGGVRYNWERKDFDFLLTFPNQINPDTGIPLFKHTPTGAIWQAPTGTISLTYRFNEDVSTYWKYSRGWKGGHFNASALLNKQIVPVEPEIIDAFEIGLRGRWFDGRLSLGASLFHYTYSNYQVFIVEDEPTAPPTYSIINANDAEIYGAELDLRAEPLDGLVVSGRFGWLESQFLDFTNEVGRFKSEGANSVSPLPVTIDHGGNRLINSPQFKASASAEWTLDLGRWGALIPRYDFAWTDDIYFDPSEGRGSPDSFGESVLPEYSVGQRAFWLHSAQLAYRTPDRNIEVVGWVRNFTDQVYKTFAFDASTFSKVVLNFVGEPRTYGVTLSISW